MLFAAKKMDFLKELDGWWFLDVVVIILVTWLLSWLIQQIFPWIADRVPKRFRFLTLALAPLLRLVFLVVAGILLFSRTVDISAGNLVTLLSVTGVALGFAFKDYVSSILAGIVTLYEMPYRLGDWISVKGKYGEVKQIDMRSVTLVSPDDTAIVIPHLKLWDELYLNANNGTPYLMCVAEFHLHPAHDGELVCHTLYDVALTSPWLQFEKPIVVVSMEHAWGTLYRLKAYPVDPRDQFQFVTDLTMRGKAALGAMNVTFAAVPVATRLATSANDTA